jgi:hypothetical protein
LIAGNVVRYFFPLWIHVNVKKKVGLPCFPQIAIAS